MAQAAVAWAEGDVPVSARYDDPYFSLRGGLAETAHVFLAGNALPRRFRPGFRIAELGFGTGLNMLAAWAAWRAAGVAGPLRYTGFEAAPMTAADIGRALSAFPELSPLLPPFLAAWRAGARRMHLPGLLAEVVVGDARTTLPRWPGRADAWFLDGFAPARNPEMWEPPLLAALVRRMAPGGTLATYSAAGAMRRALTAEGLTIERRPGFAGKRHMTVGWRA
ncbi:tRNA (5-methylaminomethyl-2-thiouridine)(34)-methyltransferase MnmD [Rhodobaculum claviforme]|uniref:FAD-dependent oxidoreductase n=1 Tax=Rhodobaculum claviforme TaxID=1549854 RepID=A0A934TJT9_9RHOB|nr:tRNA (5-methylaminomethyl-2-thiouridine)(34)-methyltransferase MnmD [Rhodobaculum claviforme]MBK5927470.1 FAD-dependent oxidoreductase [Rhodobaculum claviforme]